MSVVPAPRIYRDLSIAYHGLGEQKKRDDVMREVLAIYPNDKTLQKLQLDFAKDDDKQAASAASQNAPNARTEVKEAD